jgi:recombination associated protein RdgC
MSIFFKNAQVYKLAASFIESNDRLSPATLSEKMSHHEFGPCQAQQPVSIGWTPVIPGTENLVHVNGDNWLICLKRQERILPAAALRKELAEKIDQIQKNEDRRVGSKERQTMKDEVIFSMLPKAFTKDSLHYAYINLKLGLLVVDCSSDSMADTASAFLRETIGTLPCTLLQSHCQPSQGLTSWLESPETKPDNWDLIPKLKMTQSSNSDVKVSFVNIELDSEEIKAALEHDGQVLEIDVSWNDRLTACINSKAQIKRIKFADLVTEQSMEQSGDDKESQFDTSFMIMAGELNKLIVEMVSIFGTDADSGE